MIIPLVRVFNYSVDTADEQKSLIGNIAPKILSAGEATAPGPALSENLEALGASTWNTAGTWEEKDVSEATKSQITDVCSSVTTDDTERGSASVTSVKTIEGDAQGCILPSTYQAINIS